jgi:hypothetical protein
MEGFGMEQLDLSAHKIFTLKEHLKLQVRGDFFNAFTHPNFGNPSGAYSTSTTFGVATAMLDKALNSAPAGGFNAFYTRSAVRGRSKYPCGWSRRSPSPSPLSPPPAISQGKLLGYDLSRTFVGLFSKVSGGDGSPSASIQHQARFVEKLCDNLALQNRLQWLGTIIGDSIIGYFQVSRTAPGAPALLKQMRTLAAGRCTLTWGIGRNCREFADFHKSYVTPGPPVR